MGKSVQKAVIPLFVAALATSGILMWLHQPWWLGLLFAVLTCAMYAVAAGTLAFYQRSVTAAMNDVFRENDSAASVVVREISVPCLLFDTDGHIVWSNQAFKEIYDGSELRSLMPEINPRLPAPVYAAEVNGRSFQIMNVDTPRKEPAGKLTFQYWMDRTEALHYSRLYEEHMPTVSLIQVDNYEDLNADKQFRRNAVMDEVERKVTELVNSIHGIYRRYEANKFIVIFEAQRIEELEKQRFSLLDAVREIDTGITQSVTLSISVGVADRIVQSDEAARSGIQLALGRGGDQAVVKRGTAYSFYGGKHQVTTRNSRVKTRLFAEALRQLMEGSDQVLIMGHRTLDMDCMGAALGLMRCAMVAGCDPYFVLDEMNPAIENAISAMRDNPLYHNTIKTPEQAAQLLRPASVLIVVDTQRRSSILAPALFDTAVKTVVIDHHRRPVDFLQGATLTHLEAGASSACEMVTEVLQYFDENLRLTTFEAGALLAGITMDTKHFAFNTGARTFEAASYLRRNGADNITVKMMFQDDMETYRSRAEVVDSAIMMEHGIAIGSCPRGIESPALIAAQAADELVSIKGISASFVLAETNDHITISGRSLGSINVQIILEQLGGGGHLSIAGAQIYDATMDQAIGMLTESIKSYLKEVDIQ